MAMKVLQARVVGGNIRIALHIDTDRHVPDPDLPAPKAGAKDNRPSVPDPRYVIQRDWAVAEDGQDAQEHLDSIIEEMRLLAEEELARLTAVQQPTEQVLDIEGTAL